MSKLLRAIGRGLAHVYLIPTYCRMFVLRRRLKALRAGRMVSFGGAKWEVSRIEPVECDYDPDYKFRLGLVQRDSTGKIVNVATGIRNSDLD